MCNCGRKEYFAVPTVRYFDVISEERVKQRKTNFSKRVLYPSNTVWMAHRAGMDDLEKRKITFLY
jgi:hypothetical protein